MSIGKRFAILVGMPEYTNTYWEPLPYIKNDIHGESGLKSILENKLGSGYCFKRVEVAPHDQGGSELKSYIWKFIDDIQPELSDDSLIIVYFSGHGILHPIYGMPALVCYNTTPEEPDTTGISFDWIYNLIAKSKGQVFLIIDSCFSGKISEDKFNLDKIRTASTAIFASSSESESSFSTPDHSKSLFTAKLINGLLGNELAMENGEVTTSSLKDYLDNEFESEVQTPVCIVPEKPMVVSVPNKPLTIRQHKLGDLDAKAIKKYVITIKRRLETEIIFSNSDNFIYQDANDYHIVKEEDRLIKIRFESDDWNPPSTSMIDKLSLWLERDQTRIAIIQGDTGMGKTSVLWRFWLECANSWIDNKSKILPIFIDLRIFSGARLHARSSRTARDNYHDDYSEATRKFRAILIDYLQNELGLPFYWSTLKDICSEKTVLLIFDGLDEMSQDGGDKSIETHLRLINELASIGVKTIISARTHYFKSESAFIELLQISGLSWSSCFIFELRPFQPEHIKMYVSSYLDADRREYWDTIIKNASNLLTISSRPFLLGSLVDLLKQHNKGDKEITESSIYIHYLNEWLKRDRWRYDEFIEDFRQIVERDLSTLHGSELIPEFDKDQEDLVSWSEGLLTKFIETLALESYLEDKHYYTSEEISDYLRGKMPSLPDIFIGFFEYAIRTCTFMKRDEEGHYKFIDDSVESFFAAKRMHWEINRIRYSWDVTLDGSSSLVPIPYSLGVKPISGEIRQFLLDFFTKADEPKLKSFITTLKDRISRNPFTLKYLGGNCLTIISHINNERLKGSYKNTVLSGCYLRSVNLSGVNFECSVFEDCDFADANFYRTKLDGAQFFRCDFENAEFNEADINGSAVIKSCSGIETIRNKSKSFKYALSQSEKGARKLSIPTIEELTKMRILPGGRYLAGAKRSDANAPDELPQHEVAVSPFAIDTHPVTNYQFAQFVQNNPEWGKQAVINRLQNAYYLKDWDDDNNPPEDKDDHPVTYVSWFAAVAYASWVGKRLPTEAEWEFALRDGRHEDALKFPWGNEISDFPSQYHDFISRHEVISVKERNLPRSQNYNLLFMSGNVNEWVHDWYAEKYYKELKDHPDSCRNPTGPTFGSRRVFRGGSFLSGIDAKMSQFTCYYRDSLLPQNTNQDMGFRCVMEAGKCTERGLIDEE